MIRLSIEFVNANCWALIDAGFDGVYLDNVGPAGTGNGTQFTRFANYWNAQGGIPGAEYTRE